MIGGKGVERVVEIELNGTERAMFEKSVQSVEGLGRRLQKDCSRISANKSSVRRLGPSSFEARSARSPRMTRSSTGPKLLPMNIHEYQAKAVLREFGVPVPRGIPAMSVEEAVKAANELGGPVWVVKAQIHAGGRGKAGGVKVVKSVDDVKREAGRLLGSTLVTHQTGPHGKEVRRLYIEEGSSIDREYYLSALVDRSTSRIAFVASTEGGMDIEEVARTSPEKIVSFSVDPATGFMPHHTLQVAHALGLSRDVAKQAASVLPKLYRGVRRQRHESARNQSAGGHQIRPARLPRRQDRLRRQRALSSSGHRSAARSGRRGCQGDRGARYDLNYVALDGTIGCMVNGAGLAMATMDIIKLYGETPANFLDVGGGATKDKVTAAFKIITSDPNVKGILINIFGGIMRCDIIAEGVVAAVKDVGLTVPLVVRLEGTNVELGKEIIRKSRPQRHFRRRSRRCGAEDRQGGQEGQLGCRAGSPRWLRRCLRSRLQARLPAPARTIAAGSW